MQLDTSKGLLGKHGIVVALIDFVADQLLIVYKNDGIKGFYKGLVPSLILVSNPAVQYMVYEQVKGIAVKYRQKSNSKLVCCSLFLFSWVNYSP